MAEKLIDGRIVHKHDTEANWNKATNFIPKKGETIIYDPDSSYTYARVKVGDGTTKVTSLPFIDNAIKTAQTNLSDTVDSVKNNSITALSVSGRTITYTKGSGATGTITTQDNNTTYSAGTGLSLSGTTFNHKNSITAATAQGSASKTLTFGDTFTIPTITYDAQGHITSKGTTTMTMPAGPVAKEGNPVSEWGIKGTGISVETTFSPIQSGSGEPYPDGGSKNLFDYKNYTSKTSNIGTELNGDILRVYTTTNGSYSGLKYKTFTATAGTTYAGSLLINTFTSGVLTYGLRDASTNTFVVNKKVTSAGVVNFTYTPTEDIEVYPSILVTNNSILSGDVTFSNVQLEVGSTATEYAPYSNIRPISGFNSAKLTRCGKNLLPNNSSTKTTSGITFTVNADGSITANGTATDTAILTLVTSTSNPELRNALLGKQITLSGCPSGGSSKTYDLRIYQYADANSYLMDYGSGKTATFTNAELPFNVAILIRSGVSVSNLVFRPQIELGSTATAYEPYQGDTFTADFGQTVYGGTLDWTAGMLTVDRAMKSFTGEEHWAKSSTTTSDRFISPVSGALAGSKVVCSHGNGEGNTDDLNHCYITVSSNFAWNYSSHGSTTVEAFKAYLAAQNTAGTPVQIVYKLATPTTIQLTPHDLHMLDDINNVYSDGTTNYVIFNSGASSLGKAYELFFKKTDTISLTGSVTGSGTFDDSGNLSIATTTNHTHSYLPLSGGTLTGYLTLQNDVAYPRLLFKSSSYNGSQGEMFYRILNDEASSNFLFRQYCRSSEDYSLLSTYEDFKLPQTTADRAYSGYYDILTTKSAVTITQGGTGATTASGARTTLEVPSKTGDGASGTWGIDITGSSNKISYSTQLTTDDAINAFNTGNTFQVSTWNNTSSPGVSNGILINAGWTSSAYGVQIAIDDDPTYYIALRQKDNNGWNAWKRIPMGDGTGASGTWGISITGNAATATKLATERTIQTNLDSTSSASFDGSKNITPGVTGILAVANGGTGQETSRDACIAFINALTTGTATPKDDDYYISQYAGGGTTTTTYHRRPMSALYNYIKSKTDSLYATSSHTHSYLPLSGGTLSGVLTMKNSDKYPRMDFKSTSYSSDQGRIYYAIRPNMTESFFFFRNYSRSSTNYEPIDHYEDYKLPSATSNRTSNGEYLILTTKSTVTVAQGGTGSSTAAGARTNLGIIASTTAPSNPTDGMIWLEIVS